MTAMVAAEVQSMDLSPAEKRHLAALEGRIARGLATFREVGEALLEIRDQRLYRLVAVTFEAYCRDRWGMERNRAYQLMGAAEVTKALPEQAKDRIVNEAQARELVPLVHGDPSLMGKVWDVLAVGDAPITAPRIRAAVREVTGTGKAPASISLPTITDRLILLIERVEEEWVRWHASKPNIGERGRVKKALSNFAGTTGLA